VRKSGIIALSVSGGILFAEHQRPDSLDRHRTCKLNSLSNFQSHPTHDGSRLVLRRIVLPGWNRGTTTACRLVSSIEINKRL